MLRNNNRKRWDSINEARRKGAAFNRYPTEPLVVFIAKNYFKAVDRNEIKILEIGCSGGNNLFFLVQEGFDTYGIDHSAPAIEAARNFLGKSNYNAKLSVACATKLPYEDDFFDVVLESNVIHCNTLTDIRVIFKEIHRVMKKGGQFYGILVSDLSAEYGEGVELESRTFDFKDVKSCRGTYDGFPVIHFFNKEELEELGRPFDLCELELLISTYANAADPAPFAQWWVRLKK